MIMIKDDDDGDSDDHDWSNDDDCDDNNDEATNLVAINVAPKHLPTFYFEDTAVEDILLAFLLHR